MGTLISGSMRVPSVCAFTQMGCKYKHEMPSGKAIQISLGLNHGYPSWYRRNFSVPSNLGSPPAARQSASPPSAGRINGPWHGNRSSSFSVIGTPVSGQFSFNRRESMQAGHAQTVEEEDDELTYNGRGRANTKA